MNRTSRIYIAGHRGLVGSAILRRLKTEGYSNFILKTHKELDLERQSNVVVFFEKEMPEYVFLAAAKVGGIVANNTYPADFIYNNLIIQANIVHSAYRYGVKKLLFLGSSCIYPKFAQQPMKEEYLLTGELEPTNEPYAVSKIAGIRMCQSYNRQYGTNFISVMPTNLYGPNDNFDLNSSHVLPAMIRKFHDAKMNRQGVVTLWGTGSPRREFLHVDDLAEACVFLMQNVDAVSFTPHASRFMSYDLLNIGTGEESTIKELADMIKEIVGYDNDIVWDTTKPDGTPRKLLDVSKLKSLGWSPRISLKEGIKTTYQWYCNNL